ncbi:hypothetical protein CEXT_729321 [Caerostris extrusa]|uniref:Uncharacterized protein n=1 Tax=Caerostris extrusa TaxID=172846 RepID=A0AAV4PTD9_CAEEX|nr:hypothetical protein CEXT_729321 [Caerostris extrusa]
MALSCSIVSSKRSKDWMERRCVDGISDMDRTPCCETSKFPYSEKVFNYCVKEAVAILHHTPGYFVMPSVEGIRFSKSTEKFRPLSFNTTALLHTRYLIPKCINSKIQLTLG